MKALVLDANILIRSILGKKVRELILKNYASTYFLTPDVCILDVRKYLPVLFEKRNLEISPALTLLEYLLGIIKNIEAHIYEPYKNNACCRIGVRDLQDWPIVATALAFNSHIWTEDKDFFGAGLATWTTDRMHIFFDQD